MDALSSTAVERSYLQLYLLDHWVLLQKVLVVQEQRFYHYRILEGLNLIEPVIEGTVQNVLPVVRNEAAIGAATA